MTPEEALDRVRYEYISKEELRRIARGALTEIIVTRELLKKRLVVKND